MKPYKGTIYGWRKIPFDPRLIQDVEHLGFVIQGFRHPSLRKLGTFTRTSAVTFMNSTQTEIETLNSRYTLGHPHNYEQEGS